MGATGEGGPTAPPIGDVTANIVQQIDWNDAIFDVTISGNPSNPTYLWEVDAGASVSISHPTTTITHITFNSAGNYYVTCSVSDSAAADSPSSGSVFIAITDLPSTSTSGSYSVYQRINVTPDPTTYNIPSGSVESFTIRRKIERNDRLIIYTDIPKGSTGVNSISSEGYIIPEDLTEIQKQNAQIIINNLKSKRAFTKNTNTSTS